MVGLSYNTLKENIDRGLLAVGPDGLISAEALDNICAAKRDGQPKAPQMIFSLPTLEAMAATVAKGTNMTTLVLYARA